MLTLPPEIQRSLQSAPFSKILPLWEHIESLYPQEGKAWLGRHDRFYLLTRLLHRLDALDPWIYARCREVEAEPDDCLDLWARAQPPTTSQTTTSST